MEHRYRSMEIDTRNSLSNSDIQETLLLPEVKNRSSLMLGHVEQ